MNQMKKIYYNAKRVLIWLGPDSSDNKAKTALDLINRFADFICERLGVTMSDIHSIDDVYQKAVLRDRHKLPRPDRCGFTTDASWEPLIWFYSHKYFTRAWVIQEVNANENRLLHCGRKTIEWDRVHLVAAYFIMESAWSKHFGFSSTFCWWVLTVSGELRHHGSNWLHMLYLASNFSSADPRDIIYSLLGMIETSKGHELLRPDYGKGVLDVYRNCVKAAFLDFGTADVLLYTTDSGHPSWIPQWNRTMLFRNPFRFGKKLPWRPAGNTRVSWEIDEDLNVLSLAGVVVDVLEFVEPYNESYFGNASLESASGKESLKHKWQRILGMMELGLSQKPFTRNLLQAAATSFSFGLDENSDPGEEHDLLLRFIAYLKDLLDKETYEKYVPVGLSQEAAGASGHLFGKPVWDFDYPESSFFITKKKLVGCATSRNSPGDVLFIAHGSTYPLVLRPKQDHFLIKGFSWVSGIMYGELKDEMRQTLKIH